MLFRCSKCGKFRRYGIWVDVPQRLLTQIQNVPISYMLCQNCEPVCVQTRTGREEAGSSQPPMFTDGGGMHEPFVKSDWNHKKVENPPLVGREDCHCNNGNGSHTHNKRFCSCGNH